MTPERLREIRERNRLWDPRLVQFDRRGLAQFDRRELLAEVDRLRQENRDLYDEQPKMQAEAWGEGYSACRADQEDGLRGDSENPYLKETP